MSTKKARNFKENYQVLKEIAEKFRRQASNENSVPDIDSLVEDIEKASSAYKACKERLDMVNKKLEEVLPEENLDQSGEQEENQDF